MIKHGARASLILIFGVAAYLAAAAVGGIIPSSHKQASSGGKHVVHLINGPIHYDLLLPLDTATKEVFANLIPHHTEMADDAARWLLVGYGARGFYTTVGSYRDVTAAVVWRGITGDSAVLRADVLGALHPDLVKKRLVLSDAQYAALLAGITGDFDAWLPLTQAGFGLTDRFYPAKGHFNILRTCNVWIGEKLRNAGQRFGVWTPLPLSVSLSYRLYGQGREDRIG